MSNRAAIAAAAAASDVRAGATGVGDDDADDVDLVRRWVAAGEREALERIVERYRPRVTRLAWRLLGWGGGGSSGDLEDVVQEVFLTVLRKASVFRGQGGLWPWVRAITVNAC